MPENPNSKIIKKINSSQYDDSIKSFLREALLVENSIQHEAKPQYTSKYDTVIRRYASKWKKMELEDDN